MTIGSLDDLRQPDDRTLNFTPLGLGRMSAEDAAEFQQQVVEAFDLADAVGDLTRRSFERLRTVFAYGILCYEMYTLVNDHALLVIEQALRERFMEFHAGVVTFVDPQNVEHPLQVASYDEVFDFASGHRKWKLRIGTGPDRMPFNGMLTDLRRWARALGLLRGQRARSIEGALTRLRNYAAHGTYQLLGPVDAARTLSDLREIINQLWGQPTPGGHLYPVRVYRQVLAIAWPREGAGFAVAPAEELREPLDPDDTWEYAIVRAVHEPMSRDWQEELDRFDSLYEVTAYPADLLWGPGRRADAVTWLDSADPQPDAVDFVDRDFVIRHHAARLYMPMRPETAAALNGTDQEGMWYLVRADHPNDTFNHVRNQILGTACQDPDPTGACRTCHAQGIRSGSFADIIGGQSTMATAAKPDFGVHSQSFRSAYRRHYDVT